MSKSKKTKLKSYATAGEGYKENFAMIGETLVFSQTFQKLPLPAQNFYLKLLVWKHSQRQCDLLYGALHDFYQFEDEVKKPDHPHTESDISQEAYCGSRVLESKTFVIPKEGLEMMGYSMQNGSKLLDILRAAGFIRTKSGGKNRQIEKGRWSHTWTIWEFTSTWKKIENGEELNEHEIADMKSRTRK